MIARMVESIPFKALFDAYEKESVALYGEARVKESLMLSKGIVHNMVQTNQTKKKNQEGPRYHTAKATDKEALHITGLCERGLIYIQLGCGNRQYIT